MARYKTGFMRYTQNKKIHLSLLHLVFQNLNKQAYDLAKALLKRTAQAIEPYITNVSKRDLL